ncbi:hypothetical protein [Streptomyces sp. ITFR-6]|uniref:hypothetical protein n=1 Tax=Streptomyces sp. ITFR-6 TaxID=3075197 RepID=UPI0028895547|nr:hypothetical protein [Streptomyces sp. ITFR-6]WNI33516.1 hypothetical protein RLT59_35490 [Streptomyces sp. ITFR-6]
MTSIRQTPSSLALHAVIARNLTPDDGTVVNPSRRSKGSFSMSAHATPDPSPDPDHSPEPDLDHELSRQLRSIEGELAKLRKQRRFGQAARMVSLISAAREALDGSDSEVWAVVARSARQFAKLFDLFDK